MKNILKLFFLVSFFLFNTICVLAEEPIKVTIDGETTDYSVDESWWCLYIDGTQANDGANTVIIKDGSTYKWVYTIGWA